jgi:TPR repeat protein
MKALLLFIIAFLILSQVSCRQKAKQADDYHETIETTNYQSANQDYDLGSNDVKALQVRVQSNGDENAAITLAHYYGFSNFDLDKWVKYLTIAATNGDAISQFNLGTVYLTVPQIKNSEKAKYWFEAAAKSGNLAAKRQLEKMNTIR